MGRSYLKGIIGALIGALIATIPWILLYIYGSAMTSIFAFLVGLGALKGYQVKGLVDNKLPMIITIVSLVAISIATLVIIPSIMLLQQGINVSGLVVLYSYSPFISLLLKDYAIAVIFTFLGLRGVMYKINA